MASFPAAVHPDQNELYWPNNQPNDDSPLNEEKNPNQCLTRYFGFEEVNKVPKELLPEKESFEFLGCHSLSQISHDLKFDLAAFFRFIK